MPKKILIIDDDPTIIKLMQSRLESHHYAVSVAHDGEEGLKKAHTGAPDLIILDVLMPKLDGYTFVKEFRKHADLKAIPIIIITMKEQLHDLFKQEGIHDYLVKPIKIKDLLDKIKKYLGPVSDHDDSIESDETIPDDKDKQA